MEVDGYVPCISEPPPRRGCLRACCAPLGAALPVVIPDEDLGGPDEEEMEYEPSEPAPDDDEEIKLMAELMGEEPHESVAIDPKAPEEDDVEEDPIQRSRLIVEATSLGHLVTHRTKNPHCPSCQRAKFAHKPARRRDKKPEVVPVKFGDLVTADHMITLADQDRGNHGESTAVVVLDRATGFIGVYPLGSKTAEDAIEALQQALCRRGESSAILQ